MSGKNAILFLCHFVDCSIGNSELNRLGTALKENMCVESVDLKNNLVRFDCGLLS